MTLEKPRFAVMGAGGVGGYFGGRLAAAGADVAFIARGAHLAAMRERGLAILSPLGDATVNPVTASDDPAALGPADFVLFTVKIYDTDAAARAIAPLIGPETAVVPFQNGIDARERLSPFIAPERLMGGVAYIPSVIERPGVIRHGDTIARLAIGEFDRAVSPRAEALRAAFERAGVDCEITGDIEAALWAKFVTLAALSAVTCLTRLAVGPIRAEPATLALLADAMREVEAVARARGVALAADVVDRALDFINRAAPGFKTSMLHDLERGNRLEVEGLSGAVVRIGDEMGVDTPVHRTALAALMPYAGGRPPGGAVEPESEPA